MVRTGDGEVELNRLDIKNRTPLSAEWSARILGALEELAAPGPDQVDAIIVMDQVQERDCGTVTDIVRKGITKLRHKYVRTTIADSRSRIGEYQSVILKPNVLEAARALNPSADVPRTIEEAGQIGRELSRKMKDIVFLTVGAEGILVCLPDSVTHVPALPVTGPIDIVGAGDSTTAGIICGLCTVATIVEAAAFGNLCAGVTIRKLGTTGTASPDEVRERFRTSVAARPPNPQ
jgi:bifunctional ADP-heptose synthase (sugar kinase/adenylyltransferase)